MKFNRKALAAVFCAAAALFSALVTAGCSDTQTPDGGQNGTATADSAQAPEALRRVGIDPSSLNIYPEVLHDASHKAGFQLEAPDPGDTIAVIHTTKGDFTVRFFPDLAPKTVTNFINLARDGKYNNTTFHYVAADVGIQGGYCGGADTPNGLSSYGSDFEDEFCDTLLNLRGAVSMGSGAKDSNGSSFFINVKTPDTFADDGGWNSLESMWSDTLSQLDDYKDSGLLTHFVEENGYRFLNTDAVPQDVKALYDKVGGNPCYDGAFNAADSGRTVFAQVISGMETVDAIAALKTDSKGLPFDTVAVTSVEIKNYQ